MRGILGFGGGLVLELEDAKSTLYVQQACGNFLYYAITVDQTMLAALNAISAAQANATTTTMGVSYG